MGAIGLEPTTSRMWTQQTGRHENGVSNVILPELELFKVQLYFKEPWGLICNVPANQPTGQNLRKLDEFYLWSPFFQYGPVTNRFSVHIGNKGL